MPYLPTETEKRASLNAAESVVALSVLIGSIITRREQEASLIVKGEMWYERRERRRRSLLGQSWYSITLNAQERGASVIFRALRRKQAPRLELLDP